MSNISHAADWVGERRADNVSLAPRISEDWLSCHRPCDLCSGAGGSRQCRSDRLGGHDLGLEQFRPALKASSGFLLARRLGALVATYLALLVVLGAAALALKSDVKRFALAFTAVFFIAYASWIIGNYANFAAVTPAELQKFGISWSLKLTNEGGYIFALLAGLIIANLFPRFAEASRKRCGRSSTSRSRS